MNLIEMKQMIGEKLRNARIAKGKRQVDVNIETGLSVKNLSLMENGRCNACIETYAAYAAYLGMVLVIDVVMAIANNTSEV